jgi:four helix bundle protein
VPVRRYPQILPKAATVTGKPILKRFLQIAQGSASELEYHLLLANALKLINEKYYSQLNKDVQEIRRMLTRLIKKVNKQ